jgi:hypothetical protein
MMEGYRQLIRGEKGTAMPRLSRRAFLQVGSASAIAAAGGSFLAPAAGARTTGLVRVVRDGVGLATVVTDANPSEGAARGAQDIVAYVAKSTGASLSTATLPVDPPGPDQTYIYVGVAGPGSDPSIPSLLSGLDRDGFVIQPYLNTVTIIGPSQWGTLNGAHDFLERYLGVRWLMPTDIGEDVPEHPTIVIPRTSVRSAPTFTERMLSPLHNDVGAGGAYPEQCEWAQRNKLQGLNYNAPILFHHNLWSLFPVEEFGTTHPEYYPKSKPPKPGVQTGWQPVFTEPGTIDVAISKIKQYFADNPTADSFSLGVNDGNGFAEADPVDPYYSWVNAVVAGVRADYPDKRFGLLAYNVLETPPSFPLDPSVVPFFTQDRMAWASAAVESSSKAVIDQWLAVAAHLGFYDYIYGAPYILPRVYPHLAAAVYSYAADKGIIAQYAELYPNWGEGPKPWIRAKLQWDAAADVDDLLNEWYERAVGADAAPYLAQYYAHWEEFWTQRAVASPWFVPGATYQNFTVADYLNGVTTDEITQSRQLIDNVLSRAATPAQQARAQALEKTFQYYEASALSYPHPATPLTDQASATAMLQDAVDNVQSQIAYAQKRLSLVNEFSSDPLLVQQRSPNLYPGLLWSGWNASVFWALVGYLKVNEPTGGPVTALATDLAADHPTAQGRALAAQILQAVAAPSLVANGSFETAGADPSSAQSWVNLPRSTGTRDCARVTSVAADGAASMSVTGIGWGGPSQLVDAQSGLAHMTFRYLAPAGALATVQFGFDLCDSTGALIHSSTVRSPVTRLEPTGEWTTLTLDGEIPATVQSQPVEKLDVIFLVENNVETTVYIDAVELYVTAEPEVD